MKLTYADAISELNDIYENVLEFKDERTREAFTMAINAMLEVDDLHSSPCYDCYDKHCHNCIYSGRIG